jgi:SAM-dependent methyltransferase
MDPAPDWTGFWQDAATDGCTLALPPAARALLADGWHARLDGWPRDTRVLDVACGRGAVLALARAAGFTALAGVDLAAVPPGDLPITGGIDATALPFPDRSHDLVLSQYGLEYAGLLPAAREAARVAGCGLILLLHAAEGVLVADAAEQAAQARWLADELGIFAALDAHFTAPTQEGAATIDDLLAAIVARAETASNTSLLEAVWRGAQDAQALPDPRAAAAALAAGVAAHGARLAALVVAAPDAAATAALAGDLTAQGFATTITDAGPPLIGRWLVATRS